MACILKVMHEEDSVLNTMHECNDICTTNTSITAAFTKNSNISNLVNKQQINTDNESKTTSLATVTRYPQHNTPWA